MPASTASAEGERIGQAPPQDRPPREQRRAQSDGKRRSGQLQSACGTRHETGERKRAEADRRQCNTPQDQPERQHRQRRALPFVHRRREQRHGIGGEQSERRGEHDVVAAFARRQVAEQDQQRLDEEERAGAGKKPHRERDRARRPARSDHRVEREIEQRVEIRLQLGRRDVDRHPFVHERPRVVEVVVLEVPVRVLADNRGEGAGDQHRADQQRGIARRATALRMRGVVDGAKRVVHRGRLSHRLLSALPRRRLQLPEKQATVSSMSSFPRAATSLRTPPSAIALVLGGLLLLRPARR